MHTDDSRVSVISRRLFLNIGYFGIQHYLYNADIMQNVYGKFNKSDTEISKKPITRSEMTRPAPQKTPTSVFLITPTSNFQKSALL